MIQNNSLDRIDPNETVCMNCKHLAWLVGIGQGLKCFNEKKEIKYQPITNRRHTCDLFEFKRESPDDETGRHAGLKIL